MKEKLTDFQVKVLNEIHAQPGIMANRLATKLWLDSKAHRKHYNTGRSGACIGKGIWLSAGSHVGKLIKKGWVEHKVEYTWLGKNRRGKDKGYAYLYRGYLLTQEGERLWSLIKCSECGNCANDVPDSMNFHLSGFPPKCDLCMTLEKIAEDPEYEDSYEGELAR